MGPYRASGRTGPVAGSSNRMSVCCPALGGQACAVAVAGSESGAGSYDAVLGEAVRGMGLAQNRRGLGLRRYRLGSRTPVLYSRN